MLKFSLRMLILYLIWPFSVNFTVIVLMINTMILNGKAYVQVVQ